MTTTAFTEQIRTTVARLIELKHTEQQRHESLSLEEEKPKPDESEWSSHLTLHTKDEFTRNMAELRELLFDFVSSLGQYARRELDSRCNIVRALVGTPVTAEMPDCVEDYHHANDPVGHLIDEWRNRDNEAEDIAQVAGSLELVKRRLRSNLIKVPGDWDPFGFLAEERIRIDNYIDRHFPETEKDCSSDAWVNLVSCLRELQDAGAKLRMLNGSQNLDGFYLLAKLAEGDGSIHEAVCSYRGMIADRLGGVVVACESLEWVSEPPAGHAESSEKWTEPMTLTQIGKYFVVHRNHVRKTILSKYAHKSVGSRIRMKVTDMPLDYHQKRPS